VPFYIRYSLLILFIGLIGWFVSQVMFANHNGTVKRDPGSSRYWTENHFLIFLSGFAFISVLSFLLAVLGLFKTMPAILSFLILTIVAVVRAWKTNRGWAFIRINPSYVIFLILMTVASLGWTIVTKPFDATLHSVDASVYVNLARHVSETGHIIHKDPLVAEMSLAERETLFENRFRGDTTGKYARFPGGVSLIDIESGKVGFYFYHLFPIWLATAHKFLGEPHFINIMALFSFISLISTYFIGRKLGGNWLGLSIVVFQVFF